MNKTISLFLFLACNFLASISLPAQAYYPYPEPGTPLRGEVLAQFIKDSTQYHNTHAVYEGPPYKGCLPHACVNRLGKYALVGYDHHPVTKFEYDRLIGDWHSNIFLAIKQQLSGCIDTTGKIIIPMIYPKLYINEQSVVATLNDKTIKVFNHQGRQILPMGYQYLGNLMVGIGKDNRQLLKARNAKQDSLILFDHNGKLVKSIRGFEIHELTGTKWNKFSVKTSADFYSAIMVVDSTFQEVFTLDFYKIGWWFGDWIEGKSVKSPNPVLYHVLEKKYYPLPLDCDGVTPVKGGFDYSFITRDYRHFRSGILDKNLQLSVPPVYSSIDRIEGKNIFIASTDSEKSGLIDQYGKIILDTAFVGIRPIQVVVPDGDKGLTKLESTDFVRVRNKSEELVYNISNKSFIKGEVIVESPDVYLWKPETGSARLMRRDETLISEVFNHSSTKNLMSIVQKDEQADVVQVYDRSGKLLKTLEGTPVDNLDAEKKDLFSWRFKNGKVGIYNGDLHLIVEPKYDYIYHLDAIPKPHICTLYQYTYRHPRHDLIAWTWNNTQTMPLIIKADGSVISLDQLGR